jgi:DNA-binding XRE family transcriptional regulator
MAIVEDSAWWFLKTMGRKHRRESGRTQKQVGDDIDRSEDTIRAWELGRADIPVALAALYGKACGMTDEEAYYMRKVAAARKKGKAIEADTRYNAMFIALAEEFCMSVFKFDALTIPGPLQIQEYHYKALRLAQPEASKKDVDDGWQFKEERIESLVRRTDKPILHFLIGEAALFHLRQISDELYQDQMARLRWWARKAGISVRILLGPVYARQSNFEIYAPGSNELACPEFVYTESLDSSWCIDESERIESYDGVRKRLWKRAIRIEVYQDDDRRDRLA